MNRNELKNQIVERLGVSIKYDGMLNVVLDLPTGMYVAAVVMSKERNQMEVVGLSTPDTSKEDVEMVKSVFVEMLENCEIGDMIRSVAPKQVFIAPYEGFNHRKYLYDYVSFNVNDDMSVYFINQNDNNKVA